MFGLDKYWVFVVPIYLITVLAVLAYWGFLLRRLRDTRADELGEVSEHDRG